MGRLFKGVQISRKETETPRDTPKGPRVQETRPRMLKSPSRPRTTTCKQHEERAPTATDVIYDKIAKLDVYDNKSKDDRRGVVEDSGCLCARNALSKTKDEASSEAVNTKTPEV